MKTKLMIISSILIWSLINSCQKEKLFSGNWYSCSSKIGYSEIQFNNNHILMNFESFDSFYSRPFGYEIINDTIFLYQSNKNIIENNYDYYMIIKSYSKDSIILDFISPEKPIFNYIQEEFKTEHILTRNKMSMPKGSKSQEELSKEFFTRKEKNNCSYVYQEKPKEEGILKLDEE